MKTVKCELCPTECVLEDYQVGGCRVRINKGGELYSLVYARPCSAHIDPIEKKPFFHFIPATQAFSIATVGCVLGCKFCQNWEISQADPEKTEFRVMEPATVAEQAKTYGCKSVCYTYTEPTVFYEYMYDTCLEVERLGLRNCMHTCGYINKPPLVELCAHMDAADVDLKAFTEDFYERVCGGRLAPVLDALVTIKEQGVWLEITNLVIPTLNDDMGRIRDMCEWIVREAGPDVPVHFSRFFPYYKLKNLPPTPAETLVNARRTAMDAGLRYVYIGNMRSDAENTYCHQCGKVIVGRVGYSVTRVEMYKLDAAGHEAYCRYCGTKIPGLW